MAFASSSAGRSPQQQPAGAVIVQGVTKPYIPAKPWFQGAGTVLEVPVVKGQTVKKGDVLIRQDDRQEKAELAKLNAEASSNVRVEAADADLKIKQAQLDRLLVLQKSGGANPFEIEEARSKVIYGDAQAKIARLDLEKAKRDSEKQAVR
jgi:HlyD family secretion protein